MVDQTAANVDLQTDPPKGNLRGDEVSPVFAKCSAYISKYDHTAKFTFTLYDGAKIEAVLMPEKTRLTLCVSSQAGCARACVFCFTGRMGLGRNLRAEEITGQVVSVNQWLLENTEWAEKIDANYAQRRVHNVVFMGMGEPMDNVDAVIKAVAIMMDQKGLAIAPRKISVSTVGKLDALKRFVAQYPRMHIAFSLHAANNGLRSKIIPANKQWNLKAIWEFIRQLNLTQKDPTLIQYTLIGGLNDSEEQAVELADYLRGLRVKVNLIPYNEIAPARFVAPNPINVTKFRDVLYARGIRSMVRFSKGQDIGGACGQLVAKDLVH